MRSPRPALKRALEDGSISEAEKEEREERLRLFQQHQPYRDELSGTATSAQNP